MEPPDFEFAEGSSLKGTILLSLLIGTYGILLAIFVVLLVKRRQERILSFRSPPLLLLSNLYAFLATGVNVVSMMVGKPLFCEAINAIHCTYLPIAVLPYFTMLPKLVLQDELNRRKLSRYRGEKDKLWRFRGLFSIRARLLLVLLGALLQTAAFLALRFSLSLPGDCNRLVLCVVASFLLTYVLLLGGLLLRLRSINDPFLLRLEIALFVVAMSPSLVLLVLFPFAPAIFPPWFDSRWIVVVCSLLLFFIDLVFPVVCSFPRVQRLLDGLTRVRGKGKGKSLNTASVILSLNSQGADSFLAVLNEPSLLEAFTHFAVKTWCVENVLFYQAAETFYHSYSAGGGSQEQAQFLVQEYLVSMAPLEVNIDHRIRSKVIKEVEEKRISMDMFEEAREEVFKLMKRDSFEKFQKTAEFKTALEGIIDGRGRIRSMGQAVSVQDLADVREHRMEMVDQVGF